MTHLYFFLLPQAFDCVYLGVLDVTVEFDGRNILDLYKNIYFNIVFGNSSSDVQ